MFRKTQPERVKNQLPRESPTGEFQEVTLKGWNHHENPDLVKHDKPGGSLKCDGEFLEKRMREYDRLHALYKKRSASPSFKYNQQQDLKDLRALLELDLILLVGSDLTWDKPELGTAAALIKAPCAGGEEGQGDDDDDDDGGGGDGGGGGDDGNNDTAKTIDDGDR